MRVIFIDVTEKEVRELDIAGGLESLQELVDGYIELVRLSETSDLYVNEEGMINGTQEFFWLSGFQPYAGSGVIIGNNGSGGQVSTDLKLEDVKSNVSFLDLAAVKRQYVDSDK